MVKRRPSLDASQLGFTFEPPVPARLAADLAGLDRVIAATVGRALKDDERSRPVIAAEMSALLDEITTPLMLDAYASEARDNHNISASRLLALIAVTDRFDLLDALVRRIGAALLVGEEIHTARVGHLRSRISALTAELKTAERQSKPIERKGSRS
jgi:hypothetical protein